MKKIMLSIMFMSFLCVCNLSAESKIVKMVEKQMVEIPGKSFLMMRTEVTQELYEAVMGENPSQFKGKNKPVDSVDISDILIFCNKLSEMCGLRPVYLINGETDFRKINHYEMKRIVYRHQYYFWCDYSKNGNGFRLPTEEEWMYCAKGGKKYKYSGSDNLDEVGWYSGNSGDKTHEVATKKANGYGLYDMSGNVEEVIKYGDNPDDRQNLKWDTIGGGYDYNDRSCELGRHNDSFEAVINAEEGFGFRIVCNVPSVKDIVTAGEKKKNFKEQFNNLKNEKLDMIQIPNKNYAILKTEVTQKLYSTIMEGNPSEFKGDFNPVTNLSVYDVVYFCNKLSSFFNLTPAYSVNGETDVSKWNYTPNIESFIREEIKWNKDANGFRLPTEEEWEYAAKGGQNYKYSGSDNLEEVGWFAGNSGFSTHEVATKKANGYGLYDMSGNVSEICWSPFKGYGRQSAGIRIDEKDEIYWEHFEFFSHQIRGGNSFSLVDSCAVSYRFDDYGSKIMYSIMDRTGKLGFRIVCGVSALPSVKAGPTATVAAAGDLLDAAVAGEQQKKEFFKQKKVDEDIKRRAEEKKILLEKFIKTEMKEIPARNHLFLKTEVTQKLYEEVMGENPSEFKGKNKPVEMVSWYDAVYFCNKLSQMFGLTPAYSLNGETDVTKWNYTPHKGNLIISGKVEWNKDADGFRLPTSEEWEYAAKGGQNFTYSGSDNLNEVGWYKENSGSKTHEVATKKANGYGLYDMSGNVCELVWDARFTFDRYDRGGCWCNSDYGCEVSYRDDIYAFDARDQVDGFRVVCGVSVLPSVSK